MADVEAIAIIKEEITNVKGIPDPPDDHAESEKYHQNITEVIDKAFATVKEVKNYNIEIQKKLDELSDGLKETIKKIQRTIRKSLNSTSVKEGNVSLIKFVGDQTNTSPALQRLIDFIEQTKKVIANQNFNLDDIDNLRGCLNSWENEKHESYEDEMRRLADEQRIREEEENKRKEATERQKGKEEENKKRKDEEGRKKKQEEEKERKRREEEDRKKREEEENERRKEAEEDAREAQKKAKLEAERLIKEEEERLKKEEKEKKLREEQDRKIREENERKRRLEEAAARKKAERLEIEKQKREEEAMRKRLDPNNWQPIVYDRDCEDENNSYHKGVCCVLVSPTGSITKEDMECLASEEDDGILEILEDGEKFASSVIEIASTKGTLKTEAPMRAYIPHCLVTDPADETVMKISVDGGDWLTTTPETPTANAITKDNIKLLGVQLDNFGHAKVVIIARRKNQNIIVDRHGTSQYSAYDKNVKLFVPRDAFSEPTELKLAIIPITDENISSIGDSSEFRDSIISTSSLITLSCQRPPTKDIAIDLMRPTQVSGKNISIGKRHQLYKTKKENIWRAAESEYKGRNKDVSVTLPANKLKYSLIELETHQDVSREDVIKSVESIYDEAHKTVVRLFVKQNQRNPSLAMVHCVRKDMVIQRLAELQELHYTLGPDVSREFCVKEGQKLRIKLSGNIDTSTGKDGQNMLTFTTYMDSAKLDLVLHVKDLFKQRDLSEYLGTLKCVVPEQADSSAAAAVEGDTGTKIPMPVSLPKTEQRSRLNLKSTAVRFPPYLKALTEFLSWKLTDNKVCTVEWLDVVLGLDETRKIQAFVRMAKNKFDESDDKAICRSIITDWMKEKPHQEDKTQPIYKMLTANGLHDLSKECEEFVDYHKGTLTDVKLREISEGISGDPREIGVTLNLETKVIEKCLKDNPGSSSDQMHELLMEWRQSENALFAGTHALELLQKLLNN